MANEDILQQKGLYKTHLEFLGYTVDEDPEDEQELVARRDGGTILCRIFEGAIRLTRIFAIPESRQDDKYALLEFVNETNRKLIPQVFINLEHGSFILNLMSFTPYERVAFGKFIEMFQREIDKLVEVPNAENVFFEAPTGDIRQ
jgi:hypothetical protein